MSVRKKVTTALAVTFAAAGVVALAPLASASMTDASTASAEQCVLVADTGQVSCGDSETEARGRVSAAGYVRGAKFWNYKNYNPDGGTLTILVPRACSPGYDNEGPYFKFPDLGPWNNKASSVKTFNRCDVKLFDRENFGDPKSTWIDARADLSNVGGGWNNRASSVKLS